MDIVLIIIINLKIIINIVWKNVMSQLFVDNFFNKMITCNGMEGVTNLRSF